MRLYDHVRPYRGRVLIGAVLLLLTNILDKGIPWLLKNAVDALSAAQWSEVTRFALYVILVAAGMWIVRTFSRVYVFNVGRDVEHDLRNVVMEKIHALGSTFFARMPTGEIMSRATNDLAQIRLLVGFGILNVVNAGFAYVGAIALMFALSPELTLYALIPYPLIVVFAQAFGKTLYRRSLESQEALGMLAERAQENLSGLRVVRAFSLEERELERFEEVNQEAIRRNLRLVVLRGFMWPMLTLIGSFATLIVIWKGGGMVIAGTLTVGEFAAFHAYLAQLVWPTLAFGYLLAVVQRGRASFARVAEILEATPEVAQPSAPRPAATTGGVEIDGLTFAYGETEVLSDVSFAVAPGRSLAILGSVGSGKSTLAALLPRLLPTPTGAVRLAGDDVTTLDLPSLRAQIGYAQQDPFLFSSTIEKNIAFAGEEPSRETIRDAAREAMILSEIEELPDGFETLVGERGVQLSGGQKQRVSLARALLSDPSVLVLDDPLSAVDAKTEKAILDTLDRVSQKRSVLLITHRVAAAARMDYVIVLDEGRVVERGTHDELCAANGLYKRLAERQALEQELSTL